MNPLLRTLSLASAAVLAVAAYAPPAAAGDEDSDALAVEFELDAAADGSAVAYVTLSPDAHVSELAIRSDAGVFSAPVEIEPGIWQADGDLAADAGCFSASALVVLGEDRPDEHADDDSDLERRDDADSDRSGRNAARADDDSDSDGHAAGERSEHDGQVLRLSASACVEAPVCPLPAPGPPPIPLDAFPIRFLP